jgi:hypothetical protein
VNFWKDYGMINICVYKPEDLLFPKLLTHAHIEPTRSPTHPDQTPTPTMRTTPGIDVAAASTGGWGLEDDSAALSRAPEYDSADDDDDDGPMGWEEAQVGAPTFNLAMQRRNSSDWLACERQGCEQGIGSRSFPVVISCTKDHGRFRSAVSLGIDRPPVVRLFFSGICPESVECSI